MVAGHLREKNGYYHMGLNYVDEYGKRHTPSKSTGLTVKGNKKRAEKMLSEARAAVAEGVDIDPVAVRTAEENAALNGVQDKLTVLVGDLSDKASGRYDIITANIVANAIISLAPAVPGLMAENATFIASGIIDSRKDEVIAALEAAGLTVQEVKEKRGWECIVCKKA